MMVLLESMAAMLLPAKYTDHCELLSDWFGALVQFLLALVAFCSLLLKLYFEVPRRPFKIWLMDALKQGLGGFLAHGYNMLFSWVLVAASHTGESECVYYFINYVVDAIFGCVLNFVLLQAVELLARNYGWSLLLSGNYGKPASWSIWFIQLMEWLVIVTLVKFALLYGFILPLQQSLYTTGAWLLEPVKQYPKFELMLVMIIIPFIANTIIFWVTDNFLMDSSTPRDPLPPSKDLFYDDEDDDDLNRSLLHHDDAAASSSSAFPHPSSSSSSSSSASSASSSTASLVARGSPGSTSHTDIENNKSR